MTLTEEVAGAAVSKARVPSGTTSGAWNPDPGPP